jgi:hypothetical protein
MTNDVDLVFSRSSIYSMQITVDFPSIVVAHNQRLDRQRAARSSFSFINELRAAPAIDTTTGTQLYGNVESSRVVTLVNADAPVFAPEPMPYAPGTLLLAVNCITHNYRSMAGLAPNGVFKNGGPIALEFETPFLDGRPSGQRTKISIPMNQVLSNEAIPVKLPDIVGPSMTKKIFIKSAAQGAEVPSLAWTSPGSTDAGSSWGITSEGHNEAGVNCAERADGTHSCNTTISFLPRFNGDRGVCGGFKSPLMLFFGKNLPEFRGFSNFKLDEDSFRHTWPEKGNNGYFIVRDINGNDQIDDFREIFTTDPYTNAFQKLAKYDTNRDDKISKEDKDWDKLLLWNDINGNSKTEKNELVTMKKMGVKSISVNYHDIDVAFGTRARAETVSDFEYEKNGKIMKGECYDIFFHEK